MTIEVTTGTMVFVAGAAGTILTLLAVLFYHLHARGAKRKMQIKLDKLYKG